jgi:Homeodomain
VAIELIFRQFFPALKYRQPYTNQQTWVLEHEFLMNNYISTQRRHEVATMLSLTPYQVKIWFNNRRTKLKRDSSLDLRIKQTP